MIAKQRGKTSSQNPEIAKLAAEIEANLEEISNTQRGYELVDADDCRTIMARQNSKISLKDALQGYFPKRGIAELDSDLEGMFNTLTGYELAEAVIKRVQRYARDTVPDDEDMETIFVG